MLLGGASGPGWLARAARLVEAEKEPCAERGYLLVPTAYRHLEADAAPAAPAAAPVPVSAPSAPHVSGTATARRREMLERTIARLEGFQAALRRG